MNAKERIISCLNHEEPDFVPSFEASIDNLKIYEYYDEKYPYQGIGKTLKCVYYLCLGNKKLLNKLYNMLSVKENSIKFDIEPVVNLYRKLGIDLLYVTLGLYPLFLSKNDFIDEYGRKFEFKKNPNDNMDVIYYMGSAFNSFEEYEEFPPLRLDHPAREKAFKIMNELEKQHEMKICLVPSIMGLMESTWEAFGLENFSPLLKERKKIFDDRGKFALELTKMVIDWREDTAIFLLDDYGYKHGLFMSPANYERYVFPWLRKICNTCHKAGLKVLLHSDGDLMQIFEDLINCRIDGFHPIEPSTNNPDYDIFKLKEKYGNSISFIGNVPPQDLADKDPQYIKSKVREIIKKMAPGGGYIFSSGHSINHAVKLENFLAMREEYLKNRRYKS